MQSPECLDNPILKEYKRKELEQGRKEDSSKADCFIGNKRKRKSEDIGSIFCCWKNVNAGSLRNRSERCVWIVCVYQRKSKEERDMRSN